MIKRSIGLASGTALALLAAIVPGSASLASSAAAGGAAHQAARAAAAASAPVVWVANQSLRSARKGSVTPIDTATNTVIKKIPVSRNAIAVVLAPDGGTAWVGLNAGRLGGRGEVIPVNTRTYQAGKPVRVASIFPGTMVITPNGKTLYAGDWNSGTVTPVNTATHTAGKPIKTGRNPGAIAMAITPDGKTLYVVNEAPGTVTPIDTATNTAGRNIKVGKAPFAIVITPDGKTAYVLNLPQAGRGKDSVTPIDTATNTAGKPIPITHAASPVAANLLQVTPNGKTVYVTGNTALTPIDTATNTAGPAIRVAPRHGIDAAAAITADGSTIYVDGEFITSSNQGFIIPVSTAAGAVGKPIVVRGGPSLMAVTPDGKALYAVSAAVGGRRDIVPVNTTTGTAGQAIDTGLQPQAIAISRLQITREKSWSSGVSALLAGQRWH